MEQLDFIRNAGETRRFHTWPVLREQRVDAHSWNVAMLLYAMYGQIEPGITIPLLMAGLTHDMAEHIVGDLPAPAKRNMDQRLELKGAQTFRSAWNEMEQDILKTVALDFEDQLTIDEMRMLKLADAMEGALYCVRERAMGNALIAPCYLNFMSYINGEMQHEGDEVPYEDEPKTRADMEWDVRSYIKTQWGIYDGS